MEVPSSSSNADPSAKWVVKHDIIGNPMQMVAVPTHFFKVRIAVMNPRVYGSHRSFPPGGG